jgi:hypothetical protein
MSEFMTASEPMSSYAPGAESNASTMRHAPEMMVCTPDGDSAGASTPYGEEPPPIDADLVGKIFGVDPSPPSAHEEPSLLETAIEGGSAMMKAMSMISAGEHNENHITDAVFFALHPELTPGTRLSPGTPPAKHWISILTEVVRPLLAAPKPAAAGATPATSHGAPPSAEHATPAAPAAPSGGGAPASGGKEASRESATTGHSEKYLTQNLNSYTDNEAEACKDWKALARAIGNTCNVTSLAMALIGACDGNEALVREKVIARLNKGALSPGAEVEIGGKTVSLAKVINDGALAEQARLPDLLAALLVEQRGDIHAISMRGNLAAAANLLGLPIKAHAVEGGKMPLSSPTVREQAKQKLAQGTELMVSLPNHYTHLVEVRDDGVVLDDPEGMRVEPPGMALYSGPASARAFHNRPYNWAGCLKDSAHQKTALRRASTADQATIDMVNRVIAYWQLDASQQPAEEAEIRKAGWIDMGARNFYGAEDFAGYDLSINLEIDKNEPAP